MKKYLIITVLAVLLLFISITSVQALDCEVALTPSSDTVAKGGSVTVEVSLKSIVLNELANEQGIAGFEGVLEYDTSIFEEISSSSFQAKNGWSNPVYNSNTKKVFSTNTNYVKNAEVMFVITLKTKSDITATSAEIKLSGISVSDGNNEISKGEAATSISIGEKVNNLSDYGTTSSLSSIEITKAPTKTKYAVGDKFDKTGMVVTAKYSDGTTAAVTDYTFTPTEALKETDSKITISYTKGTVTKTAVQLITVEKAVTSTTNTTTTGTNTDTSSNKIAQTGAETTIIPIIAVISIIGIIAFINYKKMSY